MGQFTTEASPGMILQVGTSTIQGAQALDINSYEKARFLENAEKNTSPRVGDATRGCLYVSNEKNKQVV